VISSCIKLIMAYQHLNTASPPISPLQIHTKCFQTAQALHLHLITLPTEILEVILRNVIDFDSLFAWLQSCRRMYEIYDRNRAQSNTRATLDALAKREIQLRQPCLFAAVAVKDNRQPSMYLKPAIRALYRGPSSLNQNYCRALLGLRHLVGYDENAPGRPDFRFQAVTDEGGMVQHSIQRGKHNYHFVRLGQMSDQDITLARQKLWLEGV